MSLHQLPIIKWNEEQIAKAHQQIADAVLEIERMEDARDQLRGTWNDTIKTLREELAEQARSTPEAVSRQLARIEEAEAGKKKEINHWNNQVKELVSDVKTLSKQILEQTA